MRIPLILFVGALPVLVSVVSCSRCNFDTPKTDPLSSLGRQLSCAIVRASVPGSRVWPLKEKREIEATEIKTRFSVKYEGEEPKEEIWTAKVHRPKENWNGRILWYFHGVCGLGDFTRDRSAKANLKIYRELQKGKPIIVTITQDSFWLVDPELMPRFQEFMAAIFVHLIPDSERRQQTKHWAMGISMGGLNTLQVVMADREKFDFEKIVVVAPYIPRCDPFSLEGCDCVEADSPTGNTNESKYFMRKSLMGIRSQFTQEEWQKWHPIEFAKTNSFPYAERILIAWGEEDFFGFDATSKELYETAGFTHPAIIESETGHEMPKEECHLIEIARFLEKEISLEK